MHPAALQYRTLLERLDRWFEITAQTHPGVIPCRAGCSACCHGPFDITVADALLLREGLAQLPPQERAVVRERAERVLALMQEHAPDWGPPWDLRALGDDRFDGMAEALADEACPLLDDDGRCRVYAFRPLVCRLIGLPMMTAEGEILENACPIQDQFPTYAMLDPQLFDFGALQEQETPCLEAAARTTLTTDPGYETTIAAIAAEPDELPL
jgi:Fe-S-cluster containining protein